MSGLPLTGFPVRGSIRIGCPTVGLIGSSVITDGVRPGSSFFGGKTISGFTGITFPSGLGGYPSGVPVSGLMTGRDPGPSGGGGL